MAKASKNIFDEPEIHRIPESEIDAVLATHDSALVMVWLALQFNAGGMDTSVEHLCERTGLKPKAVERAVARLNKMNLFMIALCGDGRMTVLNR